MAVKDTSLNDFGLLIAYVLPGFTALWAVNFVVRLPVHWLSDIGGSAPTVGGFLYATLASIMAGLVVSTLRWMFIDTLHHRTGLKPPLRDFGKLETATAA